jgi:hypothetical protein
MPEELEFKNEKSPLILAYALCGHGWCWTVGIRGVIDAFSR